VEQLANGESHDQENHARRNQRQDDRVDRGSRGSSGEGLRRCAGALANDWSEDDDCILEEIYRERKHDSRPESYE
jgi:hypothetical protein